jgi:hypothetical protein
MNKNNSSAGTAADKCTAAENGTSASLAQNGMLSAADFEKKCVRINTILNMKKVLEILMCHVNKIVFLLFDPDTNGDDFEF